MAVDIQTQGFTKLLDPLAASPNTAVDAIFKIFYLPGVRDTINNKTVLSRYIQRGQETVAGEYTEMLIHTAENEGGGHIGEAGALPDPLKQRYKKAIYRTKYDYWRILFSGPAVASARNDRGAYLRIVDTEMRGAARAMRKDFNRILWGDGSGVLAVTGDATASLIPVSSPGGFANPGPGTQYIKQGMRIAFLDASAAYAPIQIVAGVTGYIVGAIDPENETIQVYNPSTGLLTGDVDIDTGDLVVRIATTTSTSPIENDLLNVPFGIAALVGEGNLSIAGQTVQVGEVDANAEQNWNAVVIDQGGVPTNFNMGMLQRAIDDLDAFGPDDTAIDLFISHYGPRRAYLELLQAQKQFVNTMRLDGGFTALGYTGGDSIIPWATDKDGTYGRVYGLNFSKFKMFYEHDYDWISDGSVLSRLENNDAFQACLYRYHSCGVDCRNGSVVIKDIADA